MAMITVKKLQKTYDGTPVVKGIDFQLSPGKCVALLGPNGAGKTTTLRMLSGLIRSTGGEIHFEGMKGKDIRSHIGYLPQHPVFHNWMTGKEFLVYVGQLAHLSKSEASARAEQLLERVGMADAKSRRIGKYSGGMKQRLGIAQAMIHKPKLLMLDEPVSALDPIGRREVLTLMEELKEETTLLFSTHILNDAEEVSDEIILLHKGEIVESGSMNEVRDRHRVDKIDMRLEAGFEADKQAVAALPSVDHVELDKGEWHIYVSDMDQARQQLLQLVQTNHWPVSRFEVGKATLEDLFMKVVKE